MSRHFLKIIDKKIFEKEKSFCYCFVISCRFELEFEWLGSDFFFLTLFGKVKKLYVCQANVDQAVVTLFVWTANRK